MNIEIKILRNLIYGRYYGFCNYSNIVVKYFLIISNKDVERGSFDKEIYSS